MKRNDRDAEVPGSRQEHEEPGKAPRAISRRSMLMLMGSVVPLMVGVGCERKPRRRIVSRREGPEFARPGDPLEYSSTFTAGDFPYGMVVRTVDGRPVKIEGSLEHPVNAGSSTAAMQASLLDLYDPDRLRAPRLDRKQGASLAELDARVVEALRNSRSTLLITRSNLGPAERSLIETFLRVVPGARHLVHEAVHDMPRRLAWKALYGADGEFVLRFEEVRVIVSLDSDFLGTDGAVLENIRGFAGGRPVETGDDPMSRLYVVESGLSLTGTRADRRRSCRPSQILMAAKELLAGLEGASTFPVLGELGPGLVRDLKAQQGHSMVVAGPHLPSSVHAVVAELNHQLGSMGRTLVWNPAPSRLPVNSPAELLEALATNPEVVLCLGVNPVYDLGSHGSDGPVLTALRGSKLSVGHGLYEDETVAACKLAYPSTHMLESWNDAAPRPGVHSLCQPVIRPLHEGSRQEAESLLSWTRELAPDAPELTEIEDFHDFLKRHWETKVIPLAENLDLRGSRRPEAAWEDCLRKGLVLYQASPSSPSFGGQSALSTADTLITEENLEVVVRPHHALLDGRFANNAWLQELPDPITKVVWDNAALVSPETGARLGIEEGAVLTLEKDGHSIEVPVLVQQGVADRVVELTRGHGRGKAGRIGGNQGKDEVGVHVASILGAVDTTRTSVVTGVKGSVSNRRYVLARTQNHFSQVDDQGRRRPLALTGTRAELAAAHGHKGDLRPPFIQEKYGHAPPPAPLDPVWEPTGENHWGMVIDLNRCVGCSACVTACQAENNIPVVGKDQIALGRTMHWMRIDRYQDEQGLSQHQPMLCMHCDNAPCENVCPVAATAHSPDGLNDMAYNRCVGTRYCANNCPFKVRRFNYLEYSGNQLVDPVQELVHNPQVTVRSRGVMEKCSFCVQRITAARYQAKDRGQRIPDGAMRTACQQACPAGAITFGDRLDRLSQVKAAEQSRRAYHVLSELDLLPSVTYLAEVRNPSDPDTGHQDIEDLGPGDAPSHGKTERQQG